MGLKHLEDVTYFRLNNEINRPVNGQIMLHKDQEALKAFFKENVEPNTKQFSSITEKIKYLIEENYLEKEFIELYSPEYIEELTAFIHAQDFKFKSFMAAYKFYNQYALKTNDGDTIWKAWKIGYSSTPSTLPTEMKPLPRILPMRLSTSAINRRHQASSTLVGLVAVNWFLASSSK